VTLPIVIYLEDHACTKGKAALKALLPHLYTKGYLALGTEMAASLSSEAIVDQQVAVVRAIENVVTAASQDIKISKEEEKTIKK